MDATPEPSSPPGTLSESPGGTPAPEPRADGLIPQPHGGALAPPFRAGQPSANPGGRPSIKPIRDMLAKRYDPDTPEGQANLAALGEALHRHATSNMKTLAAHAITFIRDALEGPPARTIQGPAGADGKAGPIRVTMELVPGPARAHRSPLPQGNGHTNGKEIT